ELCALAVPVGFFAASTNPPKRKLQSWRLAAGKVESRATGISAQVGEWLKPADCKSAPPCEVRRFESSPVHQHFEIRFPMNRLVRARSPVQSRSSVPAIDEVRVRAWLSAMPLRVAKKSGFSR